MSVHPDQRALVLAMWNAGKTGSELAELFHTTRGAIESLIYRLRKKGEAARRGEATAIPQEQRDEIIRLANKGVGPTAMAKMLGLSRNIVIGVVFRARRRGECRWLEAHEKRTNPKPARAGRHCWERGMPIKGLKRQAQIPTGPRHPIPDFPVRHRCVYPEGNPGEADFRWCGERAAAGPYCPEHRARCWQVLT